MINYNYVFVLGCKFINLLLILIVTLISRLSLNVYMFFFVPVVILLGLNGFAILKLFARTGSLWTFDDEIHFRHYELNNLVPTINKSCIYFGVIDLLIIVLFAFMTNHYSIQSSYLVITCVETFFLLVSFLIELYLQKRLNDDILRLQ
jgi:hypothetical protein